ncbi:MAG: response regulator transcription factor [Lachnospiraceae bacterium]|nr:response regulator transcription factor [Lachnospiraceae bacterium]
MIQVAIVEDEASERSRIRECLRYMEETENIVFGITEFSSGSAFIARYAMQYDIVFMDIQMPGMDGMKTAHALREADPAVLLIFVTNMAQFAIQGYEVDAMDYILKPINKYSFSMKVRRAIARTTKRFDEFIYVKKDNEKVKIQISDIRYLEVNGHYVTYHTVSGNIDEYSTLKEAADKVNRDYFVKCSQSYLLNLKYVSSVKKETVYIGETAFYISRSQKKPFMDAFTKFIGGR